MTSLNYGLDMPYEVQLEHHAATSTTHMTVLEPQRSPGQPATRHLLTPGVYMVSLAYNGAAAATLQHVGGGTTNSVSVVAGVAGAPRTSAPIKISVQGTNEYLQVAAPSSTGGSARATISVIPAATFDEMAESAQGVSVLSDISTLKTTLDARVPANTSLRLDTTVGTRVFAGNTMIHGDTGRRSVPELNSALDTSTSNIHGMYIRRVGDLVTLTASGLWVSGQWITEILPSGFRTHSGDYLGARGVANVGGAPRTFGNSGTLHRMSFVAPFPDPGLSVTLNASWYTGDPWPTTLPGLPA